MDENKNTGEETTSSFANEPMSETPAPEVTTNTSVNEAASTPSKSPFYIVIGIIVVAAIVGAYILLNKDQSETDSDLSPVDDTALTAEQAAAVVVTVNGTPVTQGEINESVRQLTEQARFSGIDVTLPGIQSEIKTEAKNVAINNELLKQAAAENVEAPTEEEIETTIQQIKEDSGGEEAFKQALEEINLTEEKVRQNLRDSMMIESYLDTKVTAVTVTQAEIKEMYDSYGGEEAGLPPLADVSAQIEEQLKQNGRNEQIGALIETLKADAVITEA